MPIDSHCTDDEMHVGMPGGCDDYDDEDDKIADCDGIPAASRQWLAATELERFDLGTSDMDRYEGDNGDDADADKLEEESQADDGLTQTLEGTVLESMKIGQYISDL
jgi:hypothetical protein